MLTTPLQNNEVSRPMKKFTLPHWYASPEKARVKYASIVEFKNKESSRQIGEEREEEMFIELDLNEKVTVNFKAPDDTVRVLSFGMFKFDDTENPEYMVLWNDETNKYTGPQVINEDKSLLLFINDGLFMLGKTEKIKDDKLVIKVLPELASVTEA